MRWLLFASFCAAAIAGSPPFAPSRAGKPPGTCISIKDLQAQGSFAAVVGIYSGGDFSSFEDISAELTGALASAAARLGERDWMLCAGLLQSPLSARVHVAEPNAISVHADAPQSIQPRMALGSELVVSVDSLADAAADANACAVPSGSCTLRSAMAYCESQLSSLTSPCVVQLPAHESIYMNVSLGEIQVRPTSAGAITVEGNGCSVIGSSVQDESAARLMSVIGLLGFGFSISNVTISRFGDTSAGGALYLSGLDTPTLSDVRFEDTFASSGGSIYFDNCNNAKIFRCIFSGTTAYGSNGGALYINQYNPGMVILESTFVNTFAEQNGGALFVNQYNNLMVVTNCTFFATSSLNNGGAIDISENNVNVVISGCLFNNLNAKFGGAMHVAIFNDQMTITNCTFSNIIVSSDGGTMYISAENNGMMIRDCTFINSICERNGGAIHALMDNYDLIIYGCSFIDTTSIGNGAAIYLSSGHSRASIVDCTFTGTFALFDGGAIAMDDDNNNVVISGCTFRGTSASFYGGAIYIFGYNDFLFILDCVFKDSTMAQYGGAIYLHQNNEPVYISSCTFFNTFADINGGSIYVREYNDILTITQCTFTFTNAPFDGGAIFVGIENDRMLISDCNFTDVTADDNGGAIYVDFNNDRLYISNCVFNNTAVGGEGGAVYVFEDNSELALLYCSFVGAVAGSNGGSLYIFRFNTDITIISSSFMGSVSGSAGGAMYFLDGNDNLQVSNCWFEDNSAVASGGGVAIVNANTDISLSNCYFIKNVALTSGGAIMLFFSNVHAVIDHCFCFGNIATEGASLYLGGYHTGFEMRNSSVENGISAYGAGVYIASSNEHVIITGSTIFNNEASEMGGGLYSIGSGLTIASCFLIGNRGGFDHGLYGGVLLSETVSATIVDTIFMNNTGGAGGALGIISSSNVMVSGCKFYYNTASALSGAAIWLSAVSDASITGNILGGNRAPRGGGSIFWLNSTMDEPPGVLSSNDFLSSNSALYGSSVATEAVSLLMDSNNSYNVTNYDTSVAAATVYAMDYYSQIVRDASEMAVVASVLSSTQCFEGSGYVAGGFIDIFSAGVATFGTLEAYCAPGYTMEVFLSSTIAGVSLQTSFVLWFRDCVRGEYFGDNICSECDSGTYSITDPSSVLSLSELRQTEVCLECVDGASTCYGDTVVLKDGFWRVSEYSTIAVRCPYDGSCAGGGGTGNELCADGYKGPVCGVCAENYAFRQTSQQCERCSEKSGLDAVTILFFVIIGICALIAGALYCNAGFREKVQSLDDFIMFLCVKMKLVNAESKTLEADVGIMRRLLKVRIKSYILVWQIISLLPFTLNLSYPNVYDTIASILNIFNLGISVSSLVTCSTGSNFDAIDDLVLTTVYPIVVMCLLWILHAVHVILRKARGANFVAQISARYFSAFLVFTYLILPYITVTIFQTFSCADVDPDDADSGDDRFMAIDYSVSCSSLKYQFGFIWALICVLIYPVGIPVYYFYLLYSAKNDISCRSNKMSADSLNHIKPIELLYESYEPDLWYWEVVETVHRLMLTGLLVIIGRGSGAQIVIGSIFALFYLKLCDVYRPYIDQEAQTLREICQWQIFLLFFWSIVLKAEFNSVHSVALEVLLVLTIVSNLVIDFVLSVRNHYPEKDAASDCNSISFACSENPLTTDMSITNTERSTIEMTDIE